MASTNVTPLAFRASRMAFKFIRGTLGSVEFGGLVVVHGHLPWYNREKGSDNVFTLPT